nr:type II CAAX endopeptidase family protein [uncultured Carboxylicivirga sp.]
MSKKILDLILYLIQLIIWASIIGGIGYILAKYAINITNQYVVLLISKSFEFIGVIIFTFLHLKILHIYLKYFRITKRQLLLFLKYFILISTLFVFIVFISFHLEIIGFKKEYNFEYKTIPFYLILALIISICEETMYRGVIGLHIKTISNNNISLLLSSLIFAFSHIQYDSILPFLTAMIAGLILGMLTFIYRSIFPAIAFHLGWDFSYFIFNDIFYIKIKYNNWGESFEIPQIILLTIVLSYLIYSFNRQSSLKK